MEKIEASAEPRSRIRCSPQLFVENLECFRQHARPGEHGHEVVITVPTRDDVHVKVIDHSGPGAAPKIQAHIKTLRPHGRPQQVLPERSERPKLELLSLSQLRDVREFATRHGHEMPDGVGVAVHYEKSVRFSREDEVRAVVGGIRSGEREVRFAFGRKIFDAPRSPESGKLVGIHR